MAESNCGAVKLLVEIQIGISQRIMHLFSRGQKPRLDNFVVLLPKKNFHAKNGRKMAYFSLDCRYNPELGTKNAPPGVGNKRGKTNFFFKNETHWKFCWLCLQVYEISSPFMPKFGQHPHLKFVIFFFFCEIGWAELRCGEITRRTSDWHISANNASF